MWRVVVGRRLSWMCGRRSGFSSALWSKSSTLCLLVPLLHDVVPQVVEQLVDFLAPLDFRVAEQVIEVPKIVCPPRGARTVLCAPQMADQLVEVPTEPGYALAVVAVQTLGWRAARALLEQVHTARPGRDTNTGCRDGG